MTMKTRDYLAILVTSILLSYFELLNRRTLRAYGLNHNNKDSYDKNCDFSPTGGCSIAERDRVASPNSRCGFVTGNLC
jgi:hypothetical protein